MTFDFTENPGEEWDRFVEKHTDVLFYYSIWSRVLKEGLGGRPYYSYLRDETGIVCGMPGVILTYYGVSLFYSSIPYGGFIGDRILFQSFMKRFVEWIRNVDIVYITPYSADLEGEYSRDFKSTSEAATRIDLKGLVSQDVPSCFKTSLRQGIKKADRIGLEVTRCDDGDSFVAAHRLYRQAMRRNSAIARYSESWFNAIQHIMAHEQRAFVYVANYGGIPVAASIIVNSKRGYHFLHIGSSTEHLKLNANDVIACRIIEDAIREGKEYIDFMLSDPSDTRLIWWKEKFGGTTIMLNKYRAISSPLKYAAWASAKKLYPVIKGIINN